MYGTSTKRTEGVDAAKRVKNWTEMGSNVEGQSFSHNHSLDPFRGMLMKTGVESEKQSNKDAHLGTVNRLLPVTKWMIPVFCSGS